MAKIGATNGVAELAVLLHFALGMILLRRERSLLVALRGRMYGSAPEPAQRAYASVGACRDGWRRIVAACAHIMGRHAAEGDVGRPRPRAQAMVRPLSVGALLRHIHRHQRNV